MKLRGQQYEKLALTYLKQQGLSLVSQNFHCRFGEIDLIMLDNETLVFIEVRARNNKQHGLSEDTVDFIKQKKIITTAEYYLQQKISDVDNLTCRFDVLAINQAKINWIKNAFSSDNAY